MKKVSLKTAFCTLGFLFLVSLSIRMRTEEMPCDLLARNVEALATGESGGGNPVTCYSESKAKKGASYWDCGYCQRYVDAESKGTSSTCTPK